MASAGGATHIPLPSPPLLYSLADPEHVPIGVPQMHFPHVPRHVCRRERDVQPRRHALPVDLVRVRNPHRHPRALVRRFVSSWSERGGVRASAAASLPSLAKKNLAFPGTHRPERRRRSPVPELFPAPLLEPREARGDVGHIQDRCNGFCFHGLFSLNVPTFRPADLPTFS